MRVEHFVGSGRVISIFFVRVPENFGLRENLKVFRAVETLQRGRGKVSTIGEKMKSGGLSVVKKIRKITEAH